MPPSLLRLMASDAQCQKLGIDWSGRLSEITTHITETGTYSHTASELEFGHVWRGATATVVSAGTCGAPCALDRRHRRLDGVIGALQITLQAVANGGRIQSASFPFRSATPRSADPAGRRAHRQPPTDPLCRVGGRRRSLVGDPHSADLTRSLMAQGCNSKTRTAFTPPAVEHLAGGRMPTAL